MQGIWTHITHMLGGNLTSTLSSYLWEVQKAVLKVQTSTISLSTFCHDHSWLCCCGFWAKEMASADAFRSALTKQEVMLGEHEKALCSQNKQQGSNNQCLNQVFILLQNIHEHLSASLQAHYHQPTHQFSHQPAKMWPESVFHDASFPTLDHFSGDVEASCCSPH